MAPPYEIVVEPGKDGLLIARVVGLSGCHAQAKTYDELIEKTKEAIMARLKIKRLDDEFLEYV